MLKWLRKYNTWILVIGGVLLMIAFLLPQTIQQMGKAKLAGPVMSSVYGKVSAEEHFRAGTEHAVVQSLLKASSPFADPIAASNAEHWILLTKEAEAAGLVGGPRDGESMIAEFAKERSRFESMLYKTPPDEAVSNAMKMFGDAVKRLGGDARMTEQDVYTGLAKLRGVLRLREMYLNSPRYSDRRMILGAQEMESTASVDFAVIPPERELMGVAEPSEAEVMAHFEKYKNAAPGSGEFGIGYELPDRFKLEWLTVSKDAIKNAITPDAVEVEKRYLAYLKTQPNGQLPEGASADEQRKRLEGELVNEQSEKVFKTIDQAVRAELDRSKRKLDADGDYVKLPQDWETQRPSLESLAKTVVARVQELHGITIASPAVTHDPAWKNATDIIKTPGLGNAGMTIGSKREQFTKIPMMVRELDGSKTLFIQAGVTCPDPVQDTAGNRYYFTVTHARKKSAPDTVGEVREKVATDLRRLAGYNKLVSQLDDYRGKLAQEGGLEKIAEATTGTVILPALTINKATVSAKSFSPANKSADSESVRKAVLEAAAKLDPTADPASVPLSQRTMVLPVPQSLSLVAVRVTKPSPITVEKLRSLESPMKSDFGGAQSMAAKLQVRDLPRPTPTDPFTYPAMIKRLNVEFLDGRDKSREAGEQAEKKNDSNAG